MSLDSANPQLRDHDHDHSHLSPHTQGPRGLERRRSMEQQHSLNNRTRERNYNPPVDLRLLDYVTPHDENLMCAICRCAFVEPVVLSDCGHCFCRDCIRQTWSGLTNYTPVGPRGNCPSCRAPARIAVGFANTSMSKILKNITDDLLVKCPKSDAGCEQVVKRGGIRDHVGIYCGYALVECPAQGCDLPVRRQDIWKDCLHFGVSCFACRKELQISALEQHWTTECTGRMVCCESCHAQVLHRDAEEHYKNTCPAVSIPCSGKTLGCISKGSRSQIDVHASGCTFAKLAPIFAKQQERLDQQEAAQKQMSRKLDLMKDAFDAMQNKFCPSLGREDGQTPPETSMTFLDEADLPDSEPAGSSLDVTAVTLGEFDVTPSTDSYASPSTAAAHAIRTGIDATPTRSSSGAPAPQSNQLSESYTSDFDLASPPFPPPVTNGGPYASPLHHLLSLHETLRNEVSRISLALSELDGRHSMQNLNENLRTREEISYLGGQIAGLQRQVHWLTSAQLQRQGSSRASLSTMATGSADASAGVGVEAAVNAVSSAASALTGAARAIHRDGLGMRRGPSEEGRTKL